MSHACYNPHVVDSAVCPLCDGVLQVHESAAYQSSMYWGAQANKTSTRYLKPAEDHLNSIKNELVNTKPDTAKYVDLIPTRNKWIKEVDRLQKEFKSFKRREASALAAEKIANEIHANEKLSASSKAQHSPTPTKELVKTHKAGCLIS